MNVSYPKEKINILLLENISADAAAAFQQNGYPNVRMLKGALTETELKEAVKDVHILCIRSKTKITAAVLKAAPRLLSIGCFCIGTNQVDKAAAMEKGVAVFNAPYSNTRSVAELVIGAAIMLIRRIPEKNQAAHEGIWLKEANNSRELRGKTLGIIGYGNIGSQVSVLAEALGMRIVFYDVEKKLPLGNAKACTDMAAVLKQADIVTLHIPASKQTHNLLDAAALQHCKKGALFINYARGEVLDIEALRDALVSGQLNGAAVDVYPEEPEKNGADFTTPLQGLKNVLLTPHIGGSTEEAQVNIGYDVSAKLLANIETGSTQGSHSIPALNLPLQEGAHRILHIHRNTPGVLSAINSALSAHGINVLGQYLKTNDAIGYVVLDVNTPISKEAEKRLKQINGTIRSRIVY
jgi:D-3-phosphoglycerate dehydrogenase